MILKNKIEIKRADQVMINRSLLSQPFLYLLFDSKNYASVISNPASLANSMIDFLETFFPL